VSARALGVEEISTFRDQVRLKPVAIEESLLTDLEERVFGSTYAPESQTLNLIPDRVFGKDLVAFVERWLLEAATGDAVLPAPAPAG
jgi:hypothetical protein